MIVVSIALDAQKRLKAFSAKGHSQRAAIGSDIVCAAVTVLLRTSLAVLEEEFPKAKAFSSGRGSLDFELPSLSEDKTQFLQFVGKFLVKGIGSLESEYPDAVKMKVLYNGGNYGTE